jgi:hypothetical protein
MSRPAPKFKRGDLAILVGCLKGAAYPVGGQVV